MSDKKAKAILLLSGGLDSMLVGAILKRENIDVLALRFVTGLEYAVIKEELLEIYSEDPAKKAADFLNIPIRFVSLKDVYLDMFLNPKYGYGSAINPCLDCHILMLKTAKKIMEEEGYDFIATGEVKGQRPMSQKSQDLINAIKESGLEGRLLRPLSAKLLPITKAEEEGLINRENLYDIYGRSRNVQMKLAEEFGITDYPIPAGAGCAIVDKGYARRYNDLVSNNGKDILNIELMQYLAIGRHIRMNKNVKLLLGRNEKENDALEKRKRINCIVLRPNYNRGPFGYSEIYDDKSENIDKDIIYKSAMIMGYFSKEEKDTLSITASYYNNSDNKEYKSEIIEIDNKESKNTKFEQIV
ncbi:thiamine biosynthesis protein [Brachyspira intermedia PWS/A]|uniref:Thiamine biosynthesis protein n=1 Tax=Brachyspira intermedia (strain ATCC 51140 / PWS/A) TaxID=1045858 RepID=G0EKM1_BRAIP|nr:thiamine biosynthesis protein [Brachyspira intermedia]AEM22607.1 thiamine biosynthesis protein [Brachyspira intermedia PWS/A]